MKFAKLLLVLIAIGFSLNANIKTDVLFYVQDAGETNALLPLMHKLAKEGTDFKVLAAGVAEEVLLKQKLPENTVLHFSDWDAIEKVDKAWEREKRFPSAEVEKISQSIQPKIFISGVAFELQGQFLEAFKQRDIRTFAYWDNFSDTGGNAYFSNAHKVGRIAGALLLPSEQLSKAASFQNSEKIVVGQPTLDLWRNLAPNLALKKSLQLSDEKKTLAYVGGYGQEYEEAFKLFIHGLQKGDFKDFQILILPHPKTDGSFERELAKDVGRVITGTPTQEIVAISDILICHQSTVGMQALAIPKPVLFLMPKGQLYENFLISQGYVKRLGEDDNLESEVRKSISAPPVDIYKIMGIPENAVQKLVDLVKREIQN